MLSVWLGNLAFTVSGSGLNVATPCDVQLFRSFCRYGFRTAIVKGCRLNLRDKKGKLLQKGWKLTTSHVRLAEQLSLPCKCGRQYARASVKVRLRSVVLSIPPKWLRGLRVFFVKNLAMRL